ncbi:MAG: type VI secretion system baseplate subunit TssF [Kiritimatiellae bacterium]|nr:type VI secretion system baseplate subunit TssF [Kiritimatiellia bacterium]
MDRRLLRYYDRELQHLRATAGEFAREFPKIAGRLALDEFACADPYVERLLEGFAFLAARVQLKYDSEFPRFTQSILETVYPHYLAPTPSMAVVQFAPDTTDAGLAEGIEIARGETLRSIIGKGDRTACEYRTGHPVTLWPLSIGQVDYYTRELIALELPDGVSGKAGLRIRLEAGAGLKFSAMKTDRLAVFLRGAGELPMRLYEQVFAHARHVLLQPPDKPIAWRNVLPADRSIRRVGFADEQALLPCGARSFQGYRILQEYFAFPPRYLFFELNGLAASVARCEGNRLDVILLFDEPDVELENRVDASNFGLFCVPIVNLFPKRLDRIHLSDRFSEFHVVPDRTRPMDFEVYRIEEVTGHGVQAGDEQPFHPFYASSDFDTGEGGGAYYAVHRVPRMLSSREKQRGTRTSYEGSEVYISLVDAKAAPYRSDLRQLGVSALCTNRDLPLLMPTGRGETDFTTDASLPVTAIRCVAGPTGPRHSFAEGEVSWRAISHLSLNYLSLVDGAGAEGASALRDLLKLYGDASDPEIRRQVEGLQSVASRPVTRRIFTSGPIAFVRGLEITLTFDEEAFEGTGVFLLGAVLECFFSKYVSVNSFAETIVRTKDRGEIMRWQPRLGQRHLL